MDESLMDTPLTLIYTADLRGNLDLLPRLYTLLRQLRATEFEDEEDVMVCAFQPRQERRTLLIDLGGSCDPDIWHCAVTGGRSMLNVLDAMGYTAANAVGVLSADDRAKLEPSVKLSLIDADHACELDGVRIALAPRADFDGVQIVLQPGLAPRIDGSVVYPPQLRGGVVGVMQLSPVDGRPTLASALTFPLPPAMPSDPTIAATVDFVLDEARMFEKKQKRV
jgi:hypothetical protein